MAKFVKGQSGNQKGRPKGHKNRTTEQVRELIQTFIEANLPRLQADFDAMEPAQRLTFINNLLRHVLPPPLSLESLTESQLDQLHEYFLKRYSDDQSGKNSEY